MTDYKAFKEDSLDTHSEGSCAGSVCRDIWAKNTLGGASIDVGFILESAFAG